MSSSIPFADDELKDADRTRGCCGCIFFLLVLWIWIALGLGLALDELATRKIKDQSSTFNKIQCGWQDRKFHSPTSDRLSETYRDHSHLNVSHQKGTAYLALVICVAPFATALIVSNCLKNGQEEFEGFDSAKPGDVQKEQTIERLKTRWRRTNIAVKVIGFVGTFVFEVAAYMVFSTAFENCSGGPFPRNTLATDGAPQIGRTMYLLLSAVVATGILVIVMVALIVILTSENSNELAFVAVIAAGMTSCGCDGGCPECNAIDCDGCTCGENIHGTGDSGRTGCSEICCCCCN